MSPRSLSVESRGIHQRNSKLSWEVCSWKGESAHRLESRDWMAVVSVERGRLVHFSPTDSAENLLFETESRNDLFSWGGHRVWLGPQSLWGWPPPDAWERAAAARVIVDDERLELHMPDAGDGYPQLMRIYQPKGRHLECRVAIRGGTRAVQVMQILQTPDSTTVDLLPGPCPQWPRGYMRVGGNAGPLMEQVFEKPAVVTEIGPAVRLAFTGVEEKLAFPPQEIVATVRARKLRLAVGECTVPGIEAPDSGFYTQVYLGAPTSPVVELEQFSPRWRSGADAEFAMLVSVE